MPLRRHSVKDKQHLTSRNHLSRKLHCFSPCRAISPVRKYVTVPSVHLLATLESYTKLSIPPCTRTRTHTYHRQKRRSFSFFALHPTSNRNSSARNISPTSSILPAQQLSSFVECIITCEHHPSRVLPHRQEHHLFVAPELLQNPCAHFWHLPGSDLIRGLADTCWLCSELS